MKEIILLGVAIIGSSYIMHKLAFLYQKKLIKREFTEREDLNFGLLLYGVMALCSYGVTLLYI